MLRCTLGVGLSAVARGQAAARNTNVHNRECHLDISRAGLRCACILLVRHASALAGPSEMRFESPGG